MIITVATILGTGIAVGGAIGAILKGFYKTNKEASEDYKEIQQDFEKKIERVENHLQHEVEMRNKDVKGELKNISDKIDDMKSRYVTNENFRTYVDSISQLLKISTDRMTRIEATLDDIRDDINDVIRNRKSDKDTN